MDSRALLVLAASAAAVLAGCDRSVPARKAYAAGRYADALALYRAEVRAAGPDAPAELLHGEALAALRTGDLEGARAAADAAAVRGDPGVVALAEFLRGQVAFRKCVAAEEEMRAPVPPPTARARALAHAEDALLAWRRATASRDEWPEARRNAERAALRIARLRESGSASGGPGRPVPLTPPPGLDPGDPAAPDPAAEPPPEARDPDTPEGETPPGPGEGATAKELPRAEVLKLLDRLRDREREKMTLRRERRDAATPAGERDW